MNTKDRLIKSGEQELEEAVERALFRVLPRLMELKKEDEWITSDQARSMLNVSKTQFWHLKSRNLFEVSKMSRKKELFRRSSILEYIESHTQKL